MQKRILSTLVVFVLMTAVQNVAWAEQTVLFDQAHGQRFLIQGQGALDLSGLANLFVENEANVEISTSKLSEKGLASVDILVISGPFMPILAQEIDAIIKFIEGGGKLVLMAHIHQPFFVLFERLRVGISKAPIYEQNNILASNPRDFQVKDLAAHPLTSNLESFNVFGGWALVNLSDDVHVLAKTSNRAWIDLDTNGALTKPDAMQAFAVVLTGSMGKGEFVVFGDDAIFQNGFLERNNLKLAKNLVAWLCVREFSI